MTTSKLDRQCVGDTSSKLIDSWVVDKQLSDRKPDNKQQAHRYPGGKQPGSRQPGCREPSDRHARQPTSLLPACDVNLDHAGSPIGDNAGVNTSNRLGNTKLPALCERAMSSCSHVTQQHAVERKAIHPYMQILKATIVCKQALEDKKLTAR